MALVDRHKNITAPTLVLWGARDPWQTIADGEQLANEIPNARLMRLEDCSHWLQQDDPKAYAEAIAAFLKES
ncbi:MAG: alpha/beta hydrolase [Proteobacteria bacterium]|nr:alpha/beta hydrolase [Pseudomonadota bacterium]